MDAFWYCEKTQQIIKEKFDLDGLFFQIEQILGFKVVLVQVKKKVSFHFL